MERVAQTSAAVSRRSLNQLVRLVGDTGADATGKLRVSFAVRVQVESEWSQGACETIPHAAFSLWFYHFHSS